MSPASPALNPMDPDQPCSYTDDSQIPFAPDGNAPFVRGSIEKVKGMMGCFTGIIAVRKTIRIPKGRRDVP